MLDTKGREFLLKENLKIRKAWEKEGLKDFVTIYGFTFQIPWQEKLEVTNRKFRLT